MGRVRFASWLVVSCLAAQVQAQPVDESQLLAARQLGQEGVELFQAGDTSGALDRLQRAYSVYQAPTLGLWYGRALERSGRLVEASQRYHEVTQAVLKADATPAFRQAQVDARAALDAITPRLSKLTVQVTGVEPARVRVTLDGGEIPSALVGVAIPVNPGKHVVQVSYGSKMQLRTVEVREGEPAAVSLEFKTDLVKPPPLQVAKQGLAREQVVEVMQRAQPSVGTCMNGIAGVATASFQVLGATGELKNVRVQFDERFTSQLLPTSTVTKERLLNYYVGCISRELTNVRFPHFTQATMDISYSFRATPVLKQASDKEHAN
ncbi:MAG TPA: hypothetical protein VJV78_41200 [Polyangiales bacterium]|nr:hypothetical protein [Polyangiales bacterium]